MIENQSLKTNGPDISIYKMPATSLAVMRQIFTFINVKRR